ncbi:unnamed protein product [Oppiella nova]|uniref:Uncharacterized protein n=1 Tax=Oppiella nova TaxID=334625 RepID=A0A7R9M4E1_9ACAR|nr:unnamed protein product [Oppiella nova]CAG2170572.1 unnamed protein product [Oppiella nova]
MLVHKEIRQWYELSIAPNNTNTAVKCPYMTLTSSGYNNTINVQFRSVTLGTNINLRINVGNITFTQSPAKFNLY